MTVRCESLGLEPRQNAQCLRIAFETAIVLCPRIQRTLPVVPERRMAQVMCKARGINHILVEVQRSRQLTANLCHLK